MRWTAHITIYTATGEAEDVRLSIEDVDLRVVTEPAARFQLMAAAAGIWQAQNDELCIEAIEIISLSHGDHGIATLQ